MEEREELKEYREFVESLARGNNGEGVNRTFLNSDKDKALIVLVELFKSAKETIRIFAANLCHDVGSEREYIEALSDFIEKNGSLKILLNSYNEEDAKNSNLFKRLAYYQSEGKNVVIKRTSIRPYFVGDEKKKEVHFTVADNKGFRIETDIDNRTARCNFNCPEEAEGVVKFFDEEFVKPLSVETNLTALFGYGNK